MSIRSFVVALCAATPLFTNVASAASLVASPLSHPAGFQSVVCHIFNGGTKDIVISEFRIDDLDPQVSYANTTFECSGPGPWTLAPGRGCSRQFSTPSACSQPDACYCWVTTASGSTTSVRGNFIATVNSSTTVMTSELKLK